MPCMIDIKFTNAQQAKNCSSHGQAVSRRLLTTEARVRFWRQVDKNGNITGSPASTSVLPCEDHFTNALHSFSPQYHSCKKEERAKHGHFQTKRCLQIEPTWCTNFLNEFIAFLYMFRATMCPSSGENTVPMRHLVLVTLYSWLSGMQGGMKLYMFHSAMHTRQSTIYSD